MYFRIIYLKEFKKKRMSLWLIFLRKSLFVSLTLLPNV